MRTRSRALLAALATALLLALAAGGASANRLSLSERNFRITWAPLTVALQDGPPEDDPHLFLPTSCNVTMAGSFHSTTLAKTARSLIGTVTQASVDADSCEEEGTFEFLDESLPWHIVYTSFEGLLPQIERVNLSIIGLSVSVAYSPFFCLIRSTSTEPSGWELALSDEDGIVQSFGGDPNIFIFADGFMCDLLLIYYDELGTITTADGRSSIVLSLI
jgi:hypothetical protein